MENEYNIDQRAQMINELLKGLESAKQLRNQITNKLSLSDDNQTLNYSSLIEIMMSTFDKTITMAKQITPQNINNHVHQVELTHHPLIVSSPKSENSQPTLPASKRRKIMPRWTKTVKISPDQSVNGLDGPLNDGFSWRKYGQKGIFGARFPRGYYRCTYRHSKSCTATKQVQQSDEDPTIYQVMYRGEHSCNSRPKNDLAQAQNNTKSPQQHHPVSQPIAHEVFLGLGSEGDLEIEPNTADKAQIFRAFSFNSSLLETEHLEYTLDYSALLASPTSSGSSYFPTTSYQVTGTGFGLNVQTPESDMNSSYSGQNSVNNSPTTDDLEFPSEWLDLDPNFFCV